MKTTAQLFPLLLGLFLIAWADDVTAQGKGHNKHEKGKTFHHDRRDSHHVDHHRRVTHTHVHGHDRHPAPARGRYMAHHHDRYCSHAPVSRHHHPRARYIYYRDYDVYYDTGRDLYISWSGRNWSVSASVPVILHHVDRRHAIRMEVDYYQDDFTNYLATGRPAYRSGSMKF